MGDVNVMGFSSLWQEWQEWQGTKSLYMTTSQISKRNLKTPGILTANSSQSYPGITPRIKYLLPIHTGKNIHGQIGTCIITPDHKNFSTSYIHSLCSVSNLMIWPLTWPLNSWLTNWPITICPFIHWLYPMLLCKFKINLCPLMFEFINYSESLYPLFFWWKP